MMFYPKWGLSIGRVGGIVVVGMHRGTTHVMTPTPVAYRSCPGIQISDTSYPDECGTIRCVCEIFFFLVACTGLGKFSDSQFLYIGSENSGRTKF